jgi:archaellum biogenesis protein FlaJ (TadC family)
MRKIPKEGRSQGSNIYVAKSALVSIIITRALVSDIATTVLSGGTRHKLSPYGNSFTVYCRVSRQAHR